MSQFFQSLAAGLSDPVILFGHFTYLLLIVSMLMRRMVWLRTLAIASGLAKIIYRGFFMVDPVSVVWEAIFVAVNVGQLIVLWYYERYHTFPEDQRHFVSTMPAGVEKRSLRKLLKLASVREIPAGMLLTTAGEAVKELIFVTKGVALVERDGTPFAACEAGDYVGEMSFLTGKPASATARAFKPMRVLVFPQDKLKAAVAKEPGIRRALESSLNLNLVGKLVRSNEPSVTSGPE
ncbi:MAG TPA: cyclic nucleotide-binding domain-containing protein [Devosia sp.]|jgi:signal transduction histidine kinase|nr:cyclic nucleotide-binding domain-containing protein [Devosia sp.]